MYLTPISPRQTAHTTGKPLDGPLLARTMQNPGFERHFTLDKSLDGLLLGQEQVQVHASVPGVTAYAGRYKLHVSCHNRRMRRHSAVLCECTDLWAAVQRPAEGTWADAAAHVPAACQGGATSLAAQPPAGRHVV